MTEIQVGFLYNIASVVSRLGNDEPKSLLESYYLMRCKEITRGYGLPDKYFATKIRCPKCCLEWNNSEVKVCPILLSKRQKKRLKSRKVKESKKECIRRKQNLVNCNKIEQICTFCKKSTFITSMKPQKEVTESENTKVDNTSKIKQNETPKTKSNSPKQTSKISKPDKKKEINVYTSALDVFSLKNKNNNLVTKEPPKVIKNNKKRKDKFAGLCQQAVLASAKLKSKEETKKSVLSLFLKPSS
ncbi:unnamed protein product [Spodoptera exigua]|uniref:Uncharacterized protein n=1 Tax=Spodoptera exigua TaxID=7107 RepID=A0A922SLZ0_SPOEX|nr:hypothetical protein HF086_010624 [Spodoptera exigua]CAH0697115.1 unnamed protein product [Spodoptera exigua]